MSSSSNGLRPEIGTDGRPRCPSCGAVVTEGAAFCGMCHTGFEWAGVGLEGPGASARLVEQADCPRGHGPLEPELVAGINIHACRTCGGLLVEKPSEALAFGAPDSIRALEARAQQLSAEARVVIDGNQMAYLKCGACSGPTSRKNFEKVSGIMVDVCNAHGTWLDGGEYVRVVDFLRRGGLDKKDRFVARETETIQRQREQIKQIDKKTRQQRYARHPGLGGLAGHLLDDD